MMFKALFASVAAVSIALAGAATAAPGKHTTAEDKTAALAKIADYLYNQNSTGFVVIQDGKVLIEKYWPAPEVDGYAAFIYGQSKSGALLEDVASQQKSFIAVLFAIAIDKGLIDIAKPVSAYIGTGWSKAAPGQEAKIRVLDVLNMSSGLSEKFTYEADAGTKFFYNTPVYAITKKILSAATHETLELTTTSWLTQPLGMKETAWRQRPAALASVGNDTGLVTTPRDTALFGLMVLHGGVGNGGKRIVSEATLKALFTPSATNPAYGRLWWLNGSAYTMRALRGRTEGPLFSNAPADMVAALGAFDRRLYVVPSMKLVVVRTGGGAADKDFDQQLWTRLMKALG